MDATRRWIRNPTDEAAYDAGCRFDLKRAERVRHFFARFLKHSKGEWGGKPFELLDWQWQDVIAPLFGWKRKDGSRRFRTSYVEIPKKNGKSTLASGIGLYLLCGDGEPGAEVYSVAADRDQASIVHGEAIRMAEASDHLLRELRINRTTHNIAFARSQSWYRALSGEAETKEGLNASGLIIDELHAWKGRKLWEALKYAGRSRRQPLRFVITTAGDDLQSVCREQHDYARSVLSGQVRDIRFFPYIRAADPGDDWTKPEIWHKANPSLGHTIKLDDFAADVEEAKKTPTAQAAFKRYSLNVWATGTNPWLRIEDWQACQAKFTADDFAGQLCYAAIDFGQNDDLTALVLAFQRDGSTYLLPYFWLPQDTIQNRAKPEQYRVWADQGFLEVTPGNVTDYRFVRARFAELAALFNIRSLRFDPRLAEQPTQEMQDETGVERISFAQTALTFAEPTKEFERRILAKTLKHNGHPVLSWMAGNVSVLRDVNGNMRPVKPREQGDNRKIDGMVAAIMALAGAMADTGAMPKIEVW